jgi:hypothetical protein
MEHLPAVSPDLRISIRSSEHFSTNTLIGLMSTSDHTQEIALIDSEGFAEPEDQLGGLRGIVCCCAISLDGDRGFSAGFQPLNLTVRGHQVDPRLCMQPA